MVDVGATTLIVFHVSIASAAALYLFRFSKEDEPTINSSHDFFIKSKRRFTRELAKKINELLNSSATSNIVISDKDYRESPANTVNSEKFDNTLDEYLQKEDSSLINVHKFRETYRKYMKWSKCIRCFSIFLFVVELIMTVVHFLYGNYLVEPQNKVLFYCVNGVAVCFLIFGVAILFVKETMISRIVSIRGDEIGL